MVIVVTNLSLHEAHVTPRGCVSGILSIIIAKKEEHLQGKGDLTLYSPMHIIMDSISISGLLVLSSKNT